MAEKYVQRCHRKLPPHPPVVLPPAPCRAPGDRQLAGRPDRVGDRSRFICQQDSARDFTSGRNRLTQHRRRHPLLVNSVIDAQKRFPSARSPLTRACARVLALSLSLALPLSALADPAPRQDAAPAADQDTGADASPAPASPSGSEATPPSVDSPRAEGWLRVQVLLDRAHFSPGEIDGIYGSNTSRAIAGFQEHAGMDATGELDGATWKALTADAAATTVDHAIAAADVAGPFVALPDDIAAKAKLDALGYESAAEALGEQFHASPDLLRTLNPGARFAAGESIRVPNVIDGTAALPQAAKVVVDKSDAAIMLVDAQDKVFAQYPATMGSQHDPLPIGEWTINGVAKDPVFHYNPDLFWDAEASDEKAKIPPGPNNPVGVVWVDLSKPHYGIHGTPEPSTIGKTASHGCIRMTNWSARALAGAVSPGTPAVLRE